MDLKAYFERLGYLDRLEANMQTLFAIQRAHLYSVPFENLDIHLGREIHLDLPRLYKKIVVDRRGGYCFELNGLLAIMLTQVGFKVTQLSASSANADGTYKAEFEHLALMVGSANQPGPDWLVDVGWGDGPLEPLALENDIEQERAGRVYRLRQEEGNFLLGKWFKHYRFDLTPHELREFEGMNRYFQTSPDTMFTQKRLCTLFQPGGRSTLSDLRLIITHNRGLRGSEEKEECELSSESEARQVLREMFGVRLS
jgi:N-hydroxyarylamine O-acetyltransferase